METNSVEKLGIVEPVTSTNEVYSVQKPIQNIENVSELLAGNNIAAKNETTDATENVNKGISKGLLVALGVASAIIFRKPIRMVLGNIAKKCTAKTLKSSYVGHLKNYRSNRINFHNVKPHFCKSLNDLQTWAKELGIKKISIKDFNGLDDIEKFQKALESLTSAYNRSKGKLIMPRKITLLDMGARVDANVTLSGEIKINKLYSGKQLADSMLHELGHINHHSRLLAKGDFDLDKPLNYAQQMCIRPILGNYATTDSSEFVAEAFAAMMRGKKLSPEIMKLYAQYNGPSVHFLKA